MSFSSVINKLSTRALHNLNPELAHTVALLGLKTKIHTPPVIFESRLHQHFFGRLICSPIGLAPGFDKNGDALLGLRKLGFGFIELGGITLKPQAGNPKPRVFRLPEDRAIINRMGLNSVGVDKFCRTLSKYSRPNELGVKHLIPEPLGVNLALNNGTDTPVKDYTNLVQRTKHYADYLTINLSCPNTHGLIDQQDPKFLKELLTSINKEVPDAPALVLKLSPDMADNKLAPIVDLALENTSIKGLILTNTTTSRPASLISENKKEKGGLSGPPLAKRSKEVLKEVAAITKGKILLSSSGGIETGYDIFERMKMGAHLVQIYTAFVYEGPAVIARMQKELIECLDRENISSLAELNPFKE